MGDVKDFVVLFLNMKKKIVRSPTLWDEELYGAQRDYSRRPLRLCLIVPKVKWNRPLFVRIRYACRLYIWKKYWKQIIIAFLSAPQ